MKPCRKCGGTERYVSGRCAPCSRLRVKRWRKSNPDRDRVNRARYRAKYRGELRVKNLAYYHRRMAQDPESVRRNRRAWIQTPKGVIANRWARSKRRGAAFDRDYAAILLGDPCSYCGAPGGEIDHITPIAVGGTGLWPNLTAACRRCNARKNAGQVVAFLTKAA